MLTMPVIYYFVLHNDYFTCKEEEEEVYVYVYVCLHTS